MLGHNTVVTSGKGSGQTATVLRPDPTYVKKVVSN